MGLIREPKNIDLIVQSEPWTEQELAGFRIEMNKIKAKNARVKASVKSGNRKIQRLTQHLKSIKTLFNSTAMLIPIRYR